MDSNNWRTTQTLSDQQQPINNVEAGDWRSKFSSESRQRVTNEILESLKKHYPGQISELNKVAVKFEEKIYSVAPTLEDYLRKISVKLLAIDRKNQDTGVGSLAINPASSSRKALEAVPQRNNQGQSVLMTSTVNQPEALQQMLAPNLPASSASAGVQSSAGFSSTLTPVSGTNQIPLSNLINRSSNMQNMTGASQNGLMTSMGNGVASNVFNNQKDVPGSQQAVSGRQQLYMNQQQPQQFMRQKQPQQGVMPNPVMQSIQQQHLLQTNQMQSSQQAGNSKSNDVLHPQIVLSQQQQHPQQALIQQRQPVTHQSTQLSQCQQQLQTSQPLHLLMGQPTNTTNMLEMRQQQQRLLTQKMGHQGSASGLQQQMQGTHPSNSDMNPNQPQMSLVHQNKGPVQLQNQLPATNLLSNQGQHSQSPQLHIMSQIQSESAKLRQHLGMNQQQCDPQQRLQPSGTSMQSHNIGDQQNQIYQSQRALPAVSSASSDSTSQTGHASSLNWQEEVHTKITSLKDMYFTELRTMYQKVSYKLQQVVSIPQQENNDLLKKLNEFRSKLNGIIAFLLVNKCDITPAHREKLPSFEKLVMTVINSQRPKRPDQGPSPMQSIQQVQSHENHVNPLIQSGNIQGARMKEQKNTSFDAKIGICSQSHSTAVGQPSVYHRQLKSGVSFPISSKQMLQTSSPQNFQNSSPEVNQQNMLVSVSKAGTPPLVMPSSNPLAPSPMQGDSEKPDSNFSPLTTAGNIRVQQSAIPYVATQMLSIETSGISASPLRAEHSNPEISHGNTSTAVTKSSITEQPLDRLIKAVKSISNKALTASVNDTGSILSMIDRIAGSASGNGSRAAVGEDLAAMTKCRLQAENLASQDKSSGSRKMKRCTGSMPSFVVQTNGSLDYCFTQLVGSELSDSESTATSRAKRPRFEVNYSLLREISDINQRLIDTMIDISEEDVNPSSAAEVASESSQGVIVKCSYNAVALSPGLKSQYAKLPQLPPIQPLRLLVPSNYPNCSPVLLDKLPVNTSNENEDLSMKVKSKFSQSLCALSQPMSLNEIAKTWDCCARAVISEYAQARGGGSFSSRYGSWESVF